MSKSIQAISILFHTQIVGTMPFSVYEQASILSLNLLLGFYNLDIFIVTWIGTSLALLSYVRSGYVGLSTGYYGLRFVGVDSALWSLQGYANYRVYFLYVLASDVYPSKDDVRDLAFLVMVCGREKQHDDYRYSWLMD